MARQTGTDAVREERGSMSLEVVLWIPVIVAVLLLVVAMGRYVDMRGDVEAIARDAARAASYERDPAGATAAAQRTAAATLPAGASCVPARVDTGNFRAGGTVEVRITCDVSYDGLGLVGLPGSIQMIGQSVAPLDQFRRTG